MQSGSTPTSRHRQRPLADRPCRDRRGLGLRRTDHYFYASEADRDLAGRGANRVQSPISEPFWAIKDCAGGGTTPTAARGGFADRTCERMDAADEADLAHRIRLSVGPLLAEPPERLRRSEIRRELLPWYSNRSVDRVVQRVAIKGTEDWWRDPANNPLDGQGRR